jgi:hypothetical protein
MNLSQLSIQLSKLYNKLGNDWLTKTFDTEPYQFTVYVKKGDEYLDKSDYVAEVYSDPWMPKSFKKGKRKIGIEKVIEKFEEFTEYISKTEKTFEVKFMNIKFKE